MQDLSVSETCELRQYARTLTPDDHFASAINLDNLRAIVRDALKAGGSSAAAQAEAQRRMAACVRTAYANALAEDNGLRLYRHAYDLIAVLCEEPDMFRLFAYQRLFTRQFLARLDLPSHDCDRIFRDRLLRGVWAAIWGRDLRHLREADLRCIVQVQGLHSLPEIWQRTGILFTHWHAPFTQVFWSWLKFAGAEPGVIVGQNRWDLQQHELNDTATVALQSALDLRLAVQALAAGKHVHILPDALGGRRPHSHAFFGRRRPFQPGFAEIARRTQVPCHPASVRLADGGDIEIRIAPEFVRPGRDLPPDAYARHLVEHYADHLAKLWRACPADVDVIQIRGFKLMPPVNPPEAAGPLNPKVAFCIGMLSSGSTWVFNAVRQIWLDEAPPGRLKSLYTEKGTDIDTGEHPYFVVKTHLSGNEYWYGMENMITVSQAPVIISVRDPLDAVASLMVRFGMEFDLAVQQVVRSARSIVSLLGRRGDAIVLRYEDGTIGQPETLDRIATHIGASPGAELRRKILEDLSTERVRATIAQLAADGVINAKRPFDPATQWHAGHVGDGRIGKYAEVLSEERQKLIADQTAAFAKRFGYVRPVIKPRLTILTDLDVWRAGSFFAAWVAQGIEVIGRTLPLSVICIGRERPAAPAEVSGIKLVHVAPGVTDIASALASQAVCGTAIACCEPSNAALFRQAIEMVPACKGAPLLDFLAEEGMPARLAVTSADGRCVRFPMAALFRIGRTEAAAMDQRRALAVIAGDQHGWDEIVLACLDRAARARGIATDRFRCGKRAAHDPALREKIAATRSPVIFIGSPVPAFEFCQAHLRSLGYPFLCVSETSIFPLARPRLGLPSLQRSIADFLDAVAPAAAPQRVAQRWHQVLDCLTPQ